MVMLFMDSCDLYGAGSDVTRRWSASETDGARYSSTGGRFGGGAIHVTSVDRGVIQSIPTIRTVVMGVSLKTDRAASVDAIVFKTHTNASQVSIQLTATGLIRVRRGSTTLATSVLSVPFDQYVRLEAKVFVDNSTGTVEVRVDGEEFIDFTGDTQNSSSINTLSRVEFLITHSTFDTQTFYDDIVIMDTTGSANNDFLGDVQIEALVPDGDSAQIDFTPTGAGTTNSDRVDDGLAGPDDDTTYVESITPGHKDRYTLPALVSSTVGPILAVQNSACMRKVEAGTVVTALVTNSNGTEDVTNTVPQSTDYHYKDVILETDPDTGSAWTKSAVEAAEIGQTVVS